ncbi:MAG TPA: hypothetical protein P5279_14110 [Anaerohalosphaeraceae bacterium]|jgi:hypothetical protein|nr:hypothetical protein [Anaerohalosphaeraceae bacterium]HRT51621.1 hypothetical protein [Anaerohalosphaeraceae bacterium]HRT87330.1 hypothetical protein [Anaerohalosphaeraceae bacterium]
MTKRVKIWQCGKCAFFKRVSDVESVGECHRYPPKVASRQRGEERKVLSDVFPKVSEDNFCGEYQNKDFYKTFLQG